MAIVLLTALFWLWFCFAVLVLGCVLGESGWVVFSALLVGGFVWFTLVCSVLYGVVC